MDDQSYHSLRPKQSYNIPQCKAPGNSRNFSKSEINVGPPKEYVGTNNSRKHDIDVRNSFKGFGEYYKKYEHDEVPVKDSSLKNQIIGDKRSLTNSDLDKLESKIFKNISQELQTDENSVISLDSNIKFFKTTVLEIFENFYASMRDFELYKTRFNEILAKNKEDAIADMEDFIKDMIQHIMSSETLITNEGSRKSNDLVTFSIRDKEGPHDAVSGKFSDLATSFRDKQTNVSNFDDQSSYETNNSTVDNLNSKQTNSVIEAYKNDNYLTDSTLDDNVAKTETSTENKDEIFKIFLLSGNPCVQIKINERNLLSEINIKESVKAGKHVASADNMETLAAKKMELEEYVRQEHDESDSNLPDRDIPVKESYAKKNIYLDEDFSQERDTEKSFIAKLCNFLCKKFRKTS